MSSLERPQPRRWVPTYAVLLLSLVAISAALVILYLRTGSETYLSGALLLAIVAVYTGWSFARLLTVKVVPRSLSTYLRCPSCGYESMREYREGDRLFGEAEQCLKCGGRMVVEGIFLRSASKSQRTV
ncbi:MAG: hypothetical protein QXS92_01040 [Thermofilum sp.]|uniref:Uncharacterized protein n=1 Tax=Thermofilum pendens TaxID=2269 RepID=A0A7C4D386_THEPE